MKKAEYIKLQETEDRIRQLKLFYSFISTFFDCKPFSVKLETNILCSQNVIPIWEINGKLDTERKNLCNEEDRNLILSTIQNRISELEKEFEDPT